ncbi:unnamed protein product [Ectocarpus sp. 4 AP-2014]
MRYSMICMPLVDEKFARAHTTHTFHKQHTSGHKQAPHIMGRPKKKATKRKRNEDGTIARHAQAAAPPPAAPLLVVVLTMNQMFLPWLLSRMKTPVTRTGAARTLVVPHAEARPRYDSPSRPQQLAPQWRSLPRLRHIQMRRIFFHMRLICIPYA